MTTRDDDAASDGATGRGVDGLSRRDVVKGAGALALSAAVGSAAGARRPDRARAGARRGRRR